MIIDIQIKKLIINQLSAFFVVSLGFEPRQTEPESAVLPLHHETICIALLRQCKSIDCFFILQSIKSNFSYLFAQEYTFLRLNTKDQLILQHFRAYSY